ncbi:YncE family protein [Hymenobacter psychrotolerans]|uniref:40-residue YVTN family beta-propeller repeat-containing protein n=1 Tax=Hymenobacter psychrotolerans DSM 18569 TaxID=1121959 RepID=A0A1M6R7Q8_9BACT|nr:DUF5074 domain-containing protein [Hymenobacter psychrotolerans]SHK28482.1 40-residue YVTN family beta-propeller repeat-containing protein [Hymenobacter psychrotolerans DSM 18569]
MLSTSSLFARWYRAALLPASALLLLSSCDPDDDDNPVVPPVAATNSVFVVNEGSYGTPNGSISLFDVASKTITAPDIFQAANNRPLLADVAQNMVVRGNRGYIVANQNGRLITVSLPDFREVSTLSSPLAQPRYIAVASDDKAYVSEWIQAPFPAPVVGRVAIINLRTNTVTGTIPVGKAPEEMLLANGKLFVANSEDNTVTVINTNTDVVETTLTVGANPANLVQDANGRIWVLCAGSTDYSNPALSKLGSLSDFTATAPYTVRKRDLTYTPGYGSRVRRNSTGDQLYLKTGSGVFRVGIADATIPTTPFLKRSFYGLDIDPNNNTIYAGVAVSYSGPGRIVRYNASGTPLDSATVGILPNGFAFY